jgi:hypothetical protein
VLKVRVEAGNELRFLHEASGTFLGVQFQRTLRIPDDGRTYPLPPGMGAFPVRRVLDYGERVPPEWLKTSGVFIPMYQREAMWILFQARHWRPNAVKVAAGKINAVSGKPWDQRLLPPESPRRDETAQDYLVCPPQRWLDGFKTGKDVVRQFTAMPLGMGYTVEAQVTGKEEHGGIQVIVYEPRPGRFPEEPPRPVFRAGDTGAIPMPAAAAAPPAKAGRAMGLGAGGKLVQKVYPDPYGTEAWDQGNFGRVFVHIVNSMMWREITGEVAPATPVTARSYTEAGYPWFKLYDEGEGDLAAPQVLSDVKSISQMDTAHGFVGVEDDTSVEVPGSQVKGLGRARNDVPDGEW